MTYESGLNEPAVGHGQNVSSEDNTNASMPQNTPDIALSSDSTKRARLHHALSIAIAIIIVAALLVIVISIIHAPTPVKGTTTIHTTVAPTPVTLTAPFVNSSIKFQMYVLSEMIKKEPIFPISTFYTYFNNYAKVKNYSVSYTSYISYSNNIANSSNSSLIQTYSLERNGSNFRLSYDIPATSPPIMLYGISNKYYWCTPQCTSINITNISSISYAMKLFETNITPVMNTIKILNITNTSYSGIACTLASGTMNYTLKGLAASPNYAVGTFAECLSNKYGLPVYYEMNVTGDLIHYNIYINETGMSGIAPAIIVP